MITDEEKRLLNLAAIEVFGTMYFTPVELLPNLPAQDNWHLEAQYVKTEIGFDGPQRARLCFYFPRSLAVTIACGFLGMGPECEVEEAKILDTMREAANMMVGNLLGRLDPEGACVLGIPKAELVDDFSPASLAGGDVLALISDFGFIWALFGR